jgi:hypothetical protein
MKPIFNGDGSPWNGQVVTRYIPSTDNSAYYVGDIVLSASSVGADAYGVPQVAKAAATDVPRGVVVGIVPVNARAGLSGADGPNLASFYIPATKTQDYYVMVCEDPHTYFAIQGDGTATNQVAAKANYNAKVTVAAPSPARPFSATVIDSSTIATTSTFMLKLCGLLQTGGPNAFGAYAQWLVRFNAHELFGLTAGV